MIRRRRFLIWVAALTAVSVVANWPRAYLGSLKSFLVWAGRPWFFAHWDHGRLKWFNPAALVADVAFGLVAVVAVAWVCAWSQRTGPPPAPAASDAKKGDATDAGGT